MSDFLEDWLTEDVTEATDKTQKAWNILVVDDEPDIVNVTKLTLSSFSYKNKTLNVQHAYSAAAAAEIISNTTSLALILLTGGYPAAPKAARLLPARHSNPAQ